MQSNSYYQWWQSGGTPPMVPASVVLVAAASISSLVVSSYFQDDRHRHRQQQRNTVCCSCQAENDSKNAPIKQQCDNNVRKKEKEERWIKRLHGVAVPECGGLVFGHQQEEREILLGRVETWKDVAWKDERGRSGSGYVQFTYFQDNSKNEDKSIYNNNNRNNATKDDDDTTSSSAHWMQFIRRQKWDREGNPVDDTEHVLVDHRCGGGRLWHRRGEWFLDVPRLARSPFYDQWAMHHRCSVGEVSIFDKPLGDLDPRRHSKLAIDLESYLVINGNVVWNVSWQVVETPEHGRQVFFLRGGPSCTFTRKELEQMDPWKIGYSHRHQTTKEHAVYMKRTGHVE